MKFWKRFSSVHVNIIRRDRYQLRLTEWQSDKALVTLAINELARANLQVMLDCVRNEHPGQRVFAHQCSPNDRVVAQAQCEGYTMCLANFEALGKFQKQIEMSEPTFEPEEIESK